MLTRSEFCEVTATTTDRLKYMVRRRLLPFKPLDTGDTGAAGHRRYSALDALRLEILNDLTQRHGLSLEDWTVRATATYDRLYKHGSQMRSNVPAEHLWLGLIQGIEEDGRDHFGHLVGSLDEIASQMADEHRDTGRLTLINASWAYQRLLRRAHDVNLGEEVRSELEALTK